MSVIEIEDLNIIAIYVSDLERAIRFYTEILGFKKDYDNGPGVCLKVENVLSIYLEGGYSKKNDDHRQACVAMCLNPKGGLRGAWEKLKNSDVQTVGEYEEFGDQFSMFRIQDPDGNVIEFAGKP